MQKLTENSKKHSSKIVTSLLTFLVLGLLILSGPVSAFGVSLNAFDNSNPITGDIITTTATITINTNERINVDSIDLTFNGVVRCAFDVDGNGCDESSGIEVELISKTASDTGYGYGYEYGYGYGYAYGEDDQFYGYENSYGYDNGYGYNNGYSNTKLTYEIKINTAMFDVGKSYDVRLLTKLGDKTYESDPQSFTINPVATPSSGRRNRRRTTEDVEDVDLTPISSIVDDDVENTQTDVIVEDEESEQGFIGKFFSAITGAVIGGGAVAWGAVMAFIVLALGGFGLVRFRRNRKLRK